MCLGTALQNKVPNGCFWQELKQLTLTVTNPHDIHTLKNKDQPKSKEGERTKLPPSAVAVGATLDFHPLLKYKLDQTT